MNRVVEMTHRHEDQDEPTTLEEAQGIRVGLINDMNLITAQLREPNRTDPETGASLRGDELQTWVRKAKAALSYKRTRITYLNSWIQQKNREAAEAAKAEKKLDRPHDWTRMADAIERIADLLDERLSR